MLRFRDVGFDPLCLLPLANPTTTLLASSVSAADREARVQAMTALETRAALEWMRTAELKHARLSMLAAVGWPISELTNGAALQALGTQGRAPSILNGGLLDTGAGKAVLAMFAIASIS